MSKNIEFIAANDLPESTGDEVSVLCLENGELKQKSSCNLGGITHDLVIAIGAALRSNPAELTASQVSIESGSLYAVNTALDSGVVPSVKVKYYDDEYGDGLAVSAAEYSCEVDKYGERFSFYYRKMQGKHNIAMNISDPTYLGYAFYPWATASGGIVF